MMSVLSAVPLSYEPTAQASPVEVVVATAWRSLSWEGLPGVGLFCTVQFPEKATDAGATEAALPGFEELHADNSARGCPG